MTETMTNFMMTKVEEAMSNFNEDVRLGGKKTTSKRKYAEVKATY